MRISDWSSDVCSSDLLRDPDSAIFKDEQVRTLWSNDGSRLTVYCAKVNANNIMGGKTGFKPLTLIIDAVHKKPGTTDLTQKVWAKGQILDRKSVVKGKSGSVRVVRGGSGIIKEKKKKTKKT